MNWNPTREELRIVERAHFRNTGRRGIAKAREALSKVDEDKRT